MISNFVCSLTLPLGTREVAELLPLQALPRVKKAASAGAYCARVLSFPRFAIFTTSEAARSEPYLASARRYSPCQLGGTWFSASSWAPANTDSQSTPHFSK